MGRASLQHPKAILADKGLKRLDLSRRDVFSIMNLQFLIANYQALLAKSYFNNYSRLADFKDKLLLEDRAQLQSFIEEGRLVAKRSKQAAVDAADRASRG